MDENAGPQNIAGYFSVKEAAKILGVSTARVHMYIEAGRLPAIWAVNALMLKHEDVLNFQKGVSGRERKTIPRWRISANENTQYITTIAAQMHPGQESRLEEYLEKFRREGRHLFPGTIARYISVNKHHVSITLIWRGLIMPDEATREQSLSAFRQDFADVLDWSNATYEHSRILMHT